jgi:hypothetical protein
MREMETLVLVVHPCGEGKYSGFIGDQLVVARSRQPFLDAARAALTLGFSADAFLVMRHVGSQTDSLKAKIGEAAKWTVKEGDQGGPWFVRWKPFDASSLNRAIETIDNSSKAYA